MPASVPLRPTLMPGKLASRWMPGRAAVCCLLRRYDGMSRGEAANRWEAHPAGLGTSTKRDRMASPTARARAGRAT